MRMQARLHMERESDRYLAKEIEASTRGDRLVSRSLLKSAVGDLPMS